MTLKEIMEEIEGIKEFSLTNKEAIKILREENKLRKGEDGYYLWKEYDAYKMAIVALALTMTEEEKNTIEKPKWSGKDKYEWFCPMCGNTLWTTGQDFDRPDRCSVCGQLIDNKPFGGV
jgi:rubrerythrin